MYSFDLQRFALNRMLIPNNIMHRSYDTYDTKWIDNAAVISSGSIKYVDVDTTGASNAAGYVNKGAIKAFVNIIRTQQETVITATDQTVNSNTLSFDIEVNGSIDNHSYSVSNNQYVTVTQTGYIKSGTKLTVNFQVSAFQKGSCTLTFSVPASTVYKAASKTITITSNYAAKPVIVASNVAMSSNETTTTTISATNVSGYNDLTYTFNSNNQITESYDGVSESWNIFGISVSNNSYSNGTASRTLNISAYFYGTATLTITATYADGTVTKDITISSTYVPPFSAFSLSAQLNSKTLTWHKIKRIVSDGKASSWTVGSKVSYTLTNGGSGYNVSGVHFMYIGRNHDATTNTADFAWSNSLGLENSTVVGIFNIGTWSWSQAVTGNDETGSSMKNFISFILSGSGNLKHVIDSSPKKNTFLGPDDNVDNYDNALTPFVLFDPGEIYSSFDSMNSTSVYSGIKFSGSFWTRRYYYYFNGDTNVTTNSFINDQNASKQIAIMFRI